MADRSCLPYPPEALRYTRTRVQTSTTASTHSRKSLGLRQHSQTSLKRLSFLLWRTFWTVKTALCSPMESQTLVSGNCRVQYELGSISQNFSHRQDIHCVWYPYQPWPAPTATRRHLQLCPGWSTPHRCQIQTQALQWGLLSIWEGASHSERVEGLPPGKGN